MARSNLAQQTCCVNRSRARSSYSANVSGSTFARIISMSSPTCPRSRIRSSWAAASSTVTWTPPFQLRFLTLNTHRTTPGRSDAASGPKKNVIRNSSVIAPQSTGKSAGESMNLGSASIAGLYSLTECRRSRRGGAERGAYRRVCGAATPKPPVAVERVTPHGRPDAARGVQPGLRGLDGETPSCAGLCGGRTRFLDPIRIGTGFGRSGRQGAQAFEDGADIRLQRPLLVRAGDTGRAGGQLNAGVVLAIREPFQIGMRRQVRVRIEGHQTDVAGLRIFHVPEDVTRHVVIREGRIAEGDQPALNLAGKVAAQEEFHRADRRERDPAGHPSRRAVVQKPFLDPPPVAELLRHPVNPE